MPAQCFTKEQYKTYMQWSYFSEFLALNYKPLDWVHEEWLSELEGAASFNSVCTPKVQHWVRQSLGYAPIEMTYFDSRLARLILLPQDNLHRLLQAIGLSCYHLDVSKIIEKNKKSLLEDICGKATVQYIQQNVPLLLSNSPSLMLALTEQFEFYSDTRKEFVNFLAIGSYILHLAVKQEHRSLTNSISKVRDSEMSDAWQQCLRLKTAKHHQTLPLEQLTFEQLLLKKHSFEKLELNKVRILVTKLTRHLEPLCKSLYE